MAHAHPRLNKRKKGIPTEHLTNVCLLHQPDVACACLGFLHTSGVWGCAREDRHMPNESGTAKGKQHLICLGEEGEYRQKLPVVLSTR